MTILNRWKKVFREQDGWTFIETLIVLSILLVLTSTVGFTGFRYIGRARILAARCQIENISIALETYCMDNSYYPTEEQGLESLWEKPVLEPVPEHWNGPYLKKKLSRDPWENEYRYRTPGPNGLPFEISSFGADGKPGGEGAEGDIVSWANN